MPKEKKVTIYSTPTCHYCHQAKEFLKGNKVDFEEVDISQNEKAAEEMMEKSDQMSVPVLDINGKIIIGFDQEAVKKALGIK